jgi:hypothetical protein
MPRGKKPTLATTNTKLDEEYVRSRAGIIPSAFIIFN